ncbi:MAG: glycosyl transferase, partial [Glaciimonas sp.]|nr:glycosyl transferase [Glaciimonas sp.]
MPWSEEGRLMVILLFFSFAVSVLATLFFIRASRDHVSHYEQAKPQRFHSGDVPRLGGAAILMGSICGWLFAGFAEVAGGGLNVRAEWAFVISWVLIVLPALLGGFYEDITQRLSVRYRLLLTATSAGLACALLGVSVVRLGIPGLDNWLVAM